LEQIRFLFVSLVETMITISQIRNGKDYLRVHLSANDYYSESEKVTGYWHGQAAERMGLLGLEVEEEHFQAIRNNKHPFTGEKLTPRSRIVAYHDVVVSAPKSYSIMALTVGDDRLVEAYHEASIETFKKLEEFTAVRVRHGANVNTESYKTTGNAVCAVYQHDTSRMLDPLLHTHLVFGNVTYCEDRQKWLALQPRPMMEETKISIREYFYQNLAKRAEAIGYTVSWGEHGFRLNEVSQSIERRFSRRSIQREQFVRRYQELFGQEPNKARVEQFIKERSREAKVRFRKEFEDAFYRKPSWREMKSFVVDARSNKMLSSSREKVKRFQHSLLTRSEKKELQIALVKTGADVEDSLKEELVAENVEGQKQRQEVREAEERNAGESSSPHDRGIVKNQERPRIAQRRHRQKLARLEVLRRFRLGMTLCAALQGNPNGLLIREARRRARKH